MCRAPLCPALQFCADIEPGHSRAITCLEEHRTEPNFSPPCAAEMEGLIIQRATDFRLDPNLRRDCKNDIIVRSHARSPRSGIGV